MRKYLKVVDQSRASLGARIANYFIDNIFVYLLFVIFGIVAVVLNDFLGVQFLYEIALKMENLSRIEDTLITWLIYFLYVFLMEKYANGRTIGKFVTGSKVLSIDGTKPDTSQLLYRSLSRFVPFDGLSFLFGDNIGWHDSWSDTRVVNIKKYENARNTEQEIQSIGTKEAV